MLEKLNRETAEILGRLGFELTINADASQIVVTAPRGFRELWIAADGLTEQQLAGVECMEFAGRLYVLSRDKVTS